VEKNLSTRALGENLWGEKLTETMVRTKIKNSQQTSLGLFGAAISMVVF